MLTVRAGQKKVLREALEVTRAQRMAGELRERHGARLTRFSAAALETAVGHALARARRHGLSRAGEIEAFVALAVLVSPTFDEHPPFAALLAGSGVTRMRRLIGTASEQDWQAAARRPREAR